MIVGANIEVNFANGDMIGFELSPVQLEAVCKILGIKEVTDTEVSCFSDEGLKKFMEKTVNPWYSSWFTTSGKYVDPIEIPQDKIDIFSEICKKGSQSTLEIFIFLLQHMDNHQMVRCTYKEIEIALGKSQSTCIRAVSWLRENGYIHIDKSGSQNVYTICCL